jgi:Tol biopolymer transport system component
MLYPLPPEELLHVPTQHIFEYLEMEPGLKRLTCSLGRDVGAVYNPKEDRILWVTDCLGNWTIWSMNDDGSDKKQLTSNTMISGWPSWSPDGEEIAYWSYDLESRTSDIWRMKSDGNSKVRLTTDGSFKGPPMWSPRGDRIAYTANLTGNMEIYIMNTDGSDQRKITTGHTPEYWVESRVTWHPDGVKLFFQVTTFPLPLGTLTKIPDDVAFVEIFMINVDTGYEINLTPNLHENVRSVSPDGKKLACISLRSPNYGVWVMDEDGSNQNRLTWDGEGDRAPRFSPDGQKIVYWSLAAANQPDIWMIDVDGKNKVRLTSNLHRDVYPSWSPDGSKIVFESNRAGNFDIWLLSLQRHIETDVMFESCATQGETNKAIITVKPLMDSANLKVKNIGLHFDWNDEDDYIENLSSQILASPNDCYKALIEFSIPSNAAYGYHFYDVKVQYSEVVNGIAGPINTYEHSARDLEVGTFEHSQCDKLSIDVGAKLELLNAEVEQVYPEYLIKANEEFKTAKIIARDGDYINALSHFQKVKNLLKEQPLETTIKRTSSISLTLLHFIPFIFFMFTAILVIYVRRNINARLSILSTR